MSEPTLRTNPKLELAASFISYTDKHLFLTGRAGTGKTTFLRNLKNLTWKRHVVVAPTGVAAINAGGVTIHSFFQLPFGPQIPEELAAKAPIDDKQARQAAARFQRMTREKVNIIRSIDLLVIDEISMVRADMLDAIDTVLRRIRNNPTPFGGLQLLMIGDLQQLAPIAKEEEWKLLKDYYDSVYFFSSKALQKTDYVSIELTEIYRQRDENFIKLLGKVRENSLDIESLASLETRFKPNFKFSEDEGYITLTTHNYQAQDINQFKLNALKGKLFSFDAVIDGEFPEYSYPSDVVLKLKAGAQVMFIKNDPSMLKQFYNGKIGKLVRIDDDILYVQCMDEDAPIAVTPLVWHNCRYALNEETKEITESVTGTFTQYPLKLAWAVTIHKSQGLTFDKVIIDARQAFAHGQVYVALSRCRTLEGLVLSTSISSQSLRTDYTVNRYIRTMEANTPDEQRLIDAKNAYSRSLLAEMFSFSVFQRRLNYLIKIIKENQPAFDTGLAVKISAVTETLRTDILTVAEKFMNQVNFHLSENPDVEKNEALQERIKKACGYFLEKLENKVVIMIPEIGSDNKALLSAVNELLERFGNEMHVKLSCLKRCTSGFRVADYLETRAKASIDTPKRIAKVATRDDQSVQVAHPKLLAKLMLWREREARDMDVTHSRIAPRKALIEIADSLPLSRKQLNKISGLGQKKVKTYGAQILAIIQDYINEKNINIAIDLSPDPDEGKAHPGNTKTVSFELFKSGKSIQAIAEERGLATSTIEGHLAHFVGTGELAVDQFITVEKLAPILDFFTKTDNLSMGDAKIALGESASWSELRFAVKHIEFQKNKAAAGDKLAS